MVLREQTEVGRRPDGVIIVDNGRTRWSARVESRIGRNGFTNEQVQISVEFAKANEMDAVIPVSNRFVARGDHLPVPIPRTLLKKMSLLHRS